MTYFTPIIATNVQDASNRSESYSYYFLNITQLALNNPNFYVQTGSLPVNNNDILMGKGLYEELNLSVTPPFSFYFDSFNQSYNKTIVGIINDLGPWYFGLIDNINQSWLNSSYISGFEFRIGNTRVLSAFENEINNNIKKLDDSITIQYIGLKDIKDVSLSFYDDIHLLVTYLSSFLFVLMAIKLIQSSFIMFKRLKKELLILKTIGTSNLHLFRIFWWILFISGNIGILFGFFLGILLPQVILIWVKILINGNIFVIIPSFADLMEVAIIGNIIFFFCSFWIYRLKLQEIGSDVHF